MAEVTEQEARDALAKIEQDVDSGKTPSVIDLIFAASYLKSELARRDANRETFTMQSPPANPDAVVRQPPPSDVPPVEHPSSKIRRAAQKALEKIDECNETLRQSELKIKNEEATIEKLFGYPVREIGEKLDRLQSFEKVAEALWPFVRYFIIAGACPEAINCVVDLGRLLGHTEASKSTIAEIGERVRAETLDDVAARLESLLRGKVLSKHMPEVIDAVRKM